MTRAEAAYKMGKARATHGLSQTPTGRSWEAMISRCYNAKQRTYRAYGARGIRACQFLRSSPRNLLSLIGPRPEGFSLDRIETRGMYSCGECPECLANGWIRNIRWATIIQQNRNRRDSRFLTINGVTRHLREWSEDYGVSRGCIDHRIKAGISGMDLLKPSRVSK